MFSNLLNLRFQRNWRQAIGFYLTYLVAIVLASVVMGSIAGAVWARADPALAWPKATGHAAVFFSIALPILLGYAVAASKKLPLGMYLLVAANAGFTMIGTCLLGVVIPAVLTTIPPRGQDRSAIRNAAPLTGPGLLAGSADGERGQSDSRGVPPRPAASPAEAVPDVDGERIYGPRRLKLSIGSIVCIVFGALASVSPLNGFLAWIHGETLKNPPSVAAGLAAFFLLGIGILLLAGVLSGLPRLTVTQAGVKMESIFVTKWADWNSLDPFKLTTTYIGFFRRYMSATSGIIGTAASKNLLGRDKRFVIPNVFNTPISTIIADLNARRTQTLGASAALHADGPQAEDEKTFGVAGFKTPWLTYFILAVLAVVFAAENIFAVGPSGPLMRPTITTLVALGGLNRSLAVSFGEWYRLFTAPLLHGDLSHIVFNGIALLMAGFLLERAVGRLWFFALFFIGAVGGSLMSIAVNPAMTTSVGASGAIMGMFAAAYGSGYRWPAGSTTRSRMQAASLRVLFPSLIPLATTTAAGHIDYGAHFGGALAGGVATLLLVKTWPDRNRLPRYQNLAAGIAVAGLVMFIVSFAAVAYRYPVYERLASLIPESQLPKTESDREAQAPNLVQRYPQDPRSHLYLAAALSAAHDNAGAEREARTALQQAESFRFFLGPQLENGVRVVLAAILLDEGRKEDAKETARIACQTLPSDPSAEKVRKILTDNRLCD